LHYLKTYIMKKNNFILIVCLIIAGIQLKAQEFDIRAAIFKGSQFYVEATVIESHSYKIDREIYSSHIVNISKIYYDANGNPPALNCGTLQVITIGGEFDGMVHQAFSHGNVGLMKVGSKWILALNKNTEPFQAEITDNSLACYLAHGNSSIFIDDNYYENERPYASSYNFHWDYKEQLDEFLEMYGIAVLECRPKNLNDGKGDLFQYEKYIPTDKDKAIDSTFLTQNSSFNNEERKNRFENLMNEKKKMVKKSNSRNVHNDVTISKQNARLTGISEKYLEFEVVASTTGSNFYLDNLPTRLKYNTDAFGQNLASSLGLQVVLSNEFNNGTYESPLLNAYDHDNNVIVLPLNINSNNIQFDRILLTSTPKVLYTVKMRISNCEFPMKIEFTDTDWMSNFHLYTDNANDSLLAPFFEVDTSYYENPYYHDVTCVPFITGYDLDVTGGTNSDLNITGRYFTNMGQIMFKNADNPTLYLNGVDDIDINTWQDSYINLTVPSIIEKNAPQNSFFIPGTGIFKVANRFNYKSESYDAVKINYSISNLLLTNNIKDRHNLIGTNVNNGYTVHLNSEIRNVPLAAEAIEQAIADWNCATGYNITIGEDTELFGYAADGINVISMVNSLPNDQLMATRHEPTKTCNSDIGTIYNRTSFDIMINMDLSSIASGASWHYNTTGDKPLNTFDFYLAISHELGHAHLLNHVLNTNDIMYPNDDIYFVNAINRRKITKSYHAINGGRDVADFSASITPSSCTYTGYVPLPMSEECIGLSVYDFLSPEHFNLYPNPSNNFSILDFGNNFIDANLILLDYQGKVIFQDKIQNNSHKIDVSNLTSGIYLLRISGKNINLSKKLVKN